MMADAVVLFAVILPAIASLPLIRLLKNLALGFTCLDGGLAVVILAVLALTHLWVAYLGILEADAVHLLARTLGAGALLLRLSLHDRWSNFCRLFDQGSLLGLEDLGDLLVHVEVVLLSNRPCLHRECDRL